MIEQIKASWAGLYCRACERLRELLYQAPWSSFDLIAASVVFWLGWYFLLSPGLFGKFDGDYKVMSSLGNEIAWGAFLIAAGSFGLLVVLWLIRPPFTVRLLARMSVSFCLISLALNDAGHSPPPASTITYCVLSVATLWSVWRTKPSGR